MEVIRKTISLFLIAALGLLASCDSSGISDVSSEGDSDPGTGNQPPLHTLRLVGYFDSAHGANFFQDNFGACRLRWPEGYMDLESATVSVGQGDSLHFSFIGRSYNPDGSVNPVQYEMAVLRDADQVMSVAQVGNEEDWFLIAGADPTKPYGVVLTDASSWDQGIELYQTTCHALVFGEIAGRPQVELPKSWVNKTYVLKNLRSNGEDKPIHDLTAGNRYTRFSLRGATLELELDGSYRLTHQSVQWSPTTGSYVKEEVIEGIYRMDQDILIIDLSQEYPSFGQVSSDTLIVVNQREWFILDRYDFVFVEE